MAFMGATWTEPLPPQRDRFVLPDDVAFLDCAYISPQLRSVSEIGIEAVRRKEAPWKTAAYDWFAVPEALRTAVGRLIGADGDSVALVPSASYGIAVAAANLPLSSGQNVIVLHEQFPSNVYAWREVARSRTAELRTVRKEPADSWTDAVLDAIDQNTAIVAVPNCHWTDGALVDLARVGESARAVGAALVVDASQSLGAYPFSVDEVQPDFLVSVGYKWQLGPYGLGYLYVAPKWRNGQPIEQSWLTRAGAEDFAALVDYRDQYRPGARRFDMGEYPQFVLAPMALAAIRQLLAWRVERVQATLAWLTRMIARKAESMGCSVLSPGRRVGHMLGIRFEDGLPEALARRLSEERVHVSIRGDAIRVAPHVYNGEEDATRLLDVLQEFL
ncbi:MAG: aminotransferase class V-fold PLP-dependent enzyme [Longimicrobiaceae bacterium]